MARSHHRVIPRSNLPIYHGSHSPYNNDAETVKNRIKLIALDPVVSRGRFFEPTKRDGLGIPSE